MKNSSTHLNDVPSPALSIAGNDTTYGTYTTMRNSRMMRRTYSQQSVAQMVDGQARSTLCPTAHYDEGTYDDWTHDMSHDDNMYPFKLE